MVLTVLLLVATLLHWELFSNDHPSFWVWLVVYAITPVLLSGVWLVNRRRDPGRPAPGTAMVPRWARTVVGLGTTVAFAVLLGGVLAGLALLHIGMRRTAPAEATLGSPVGVGPGEPGSW